MDTIKQCFSRVLENIDRSCSRVNRLPDSVKLVVVVKRQPIDKILEVIEAGATRLGENFPEVIESRKEATSQYPNLEWHMIGHIQSRKVKFLDQFAVIHSVDSLELLNRIAPVIGRTIPILLEINVSGETTKQGFNLSERTNFEPFSNLVSDVLSSPHLQISGLMCMPPFVQAAEENRFYFRRCKEVFDYLREKIGKNELRDLSMGTSHDYTVAIEEGATFIRIGEGIMGNR